MASIPSQREKCGGTFAAAAFVRGASVAVSLFDESGNMLRPWAEAGWEVHCFDLLGEPRRIDFLSGGSITWHQRDLTDRLAQGFIFSLRPSFLTSFGPCDDLAVCGAKHFEAKRQKNPNFQQEALDLWMIGPNLGRNIGCPWIAENPRSVISTMWRAPDHKFNPCDFGGYLRADDRHPRWPEYIEPRDAYTKETWLWTGNGFVMPKPRRVDPIMHESAGSKSNKAWKKLGGKSAKTKQIRSETPRGFAQAVFLANAPALQISRAA